LEWKQSHARVQCLVRYSEGMVLQIGVRHPAPARHEASSLRGVLRKAFPGECVSADMITEGTESAY
jgi:hypothetical protein